MKRLAVLGLALLACRLQEPPKTYTVTVEKLLVKSTDNDATLEFELSTNLPDRAVLAVMARMAQYEYSYEHDYFSYTAPDFAAGSVVAETGVVADGRVKRLKLALPSNGLYRIEIRFDPGLQPDRTLKRKMGAEHFGLMTLHERTLAVGATRRVFEELLKDSAACRDLLRKCQETLDRLIKLGEGSEEEDAQAKKALPMVQQLANDAGDFSSKAGKTLLTATYRYVGDVLAAMNLTGAFLKDLLKKKKADEKKSGAGGGSSGGGTPASGSGDPDAPFAPNPGVTVDPATGESSPTSPGGHPDAQKDGYMPVPDPMGGGRLTFTTVAERIRKADEVRLREVFLWVIRFTRLAHESLFSAADSVRRGGSKDAAFDVFKDEETALTEIEKTTDTLLQTEKPFAAFQTLRSGQKFDEVPGLIRKYLGLVRKEIESGMAAEEPKDQEALRKEIVVRLDTFDRRIMNRKGASTSPAPAPAPPTPQNP